MQQHIDQHMQRQIDDIKASQDRLSAEFSEFRAEYREGRAELVGLLNVKVAESEGSDSQLQAEVRMNKLNCDDQHDRVMAQLREQKSSRQLWLTAAVAAFFGLVSSMLGGWSENFFSR